MLKVGITRLDISMEDKEITKSRCLSIMEEAASAGVELLAFPEMTLVGFTMEPEPVAESFENGKIPESISFFMKNSKKYNMAIAFGYIEKSGTRDGYIYENKLALVKGDNCVMDYVKLHPFTFDGEDKVYQKGNRLAQAKVKDAHIGGYICYDVRFPEIFSAARDKYDTIMVIANWPEERSEQWAALLRARAIENQAYVIGVNRIGESNGKKYVPGSYVFDFLGREISTTVSPTLSVAYIDPRQVAKIRESFPQKYDRRVDLYRKLL